MFLTGALAVTKAVLNLGPKDGKSFFSPVTIFCLGIEDSKVTAHRSSLGLCN